MRIASVGSGASGPEPRSVEAHRTATSMVEVRAALARALQSATGRAPSARTVDVLAAQVSLETAHGSQMFNFNFGGIKGSSPAGESASYMTHEVLGGQTVELQQGFRAYRTIDEGARDYVSVLRTRFPAAYTQALHGDVSGFAHALKQAHYYTAPENEYAAGLARAAPGAALGPAPGAVESVPETFSTSAELSRVIDAVSASAVHIADPEPQD